MTKENELQLKEYQEKENRYRALEELLEKDFKGTMKKIIESAKNHSEYTASFVKSLFNYEANDGYIFIWEVLSDYNECKNVPAGLNLFEEYGYLKKLCNFFQIKNDLDTIDPEYFKPFTEEYIEQHKETIGEEIKQCSKITHNYGNMSLKLQEEICSIVNERELDTSTLQILLEIAESILIRDISDIDEIIIGGIAYDLMEIMPETIRDEILPQNIVNGCSKAIHII